MWRHTGLGRLLLPDSSIISLGVTSTLLPEEVSLAACSSIPPFKLTSSLLPEREGSVVGLFQMNNQYVKKTRNVMSKFASKSSKSSEFIAI